MPQSNEAHEPQLPILCGRALEPQLLNPVSLESTLCKKEKPQRESDALQLEAEPLQQQSTSTAKNNFKNKIIFKKRKMEIKLTFPKLPVPVEIRSMS